MEPTELSPWQKENLKNPPVARITPAIYSTLKSGSPWVYTNSLHNYDELKERLPDGGWVQLSASKRSGGLALFDPDNAIALRIFELSSEQVPLKPVLKYRIISALKARSGIDRSSTNGLRLTHGENDLLPGLVIDQYDKLVVVRPDSLAWEPWLPLALEYLYGELPFEAAYLSMGRQSRWLYNSLDFPVVFTENNLKFLSDPKAGQKTGFFLDMRPNRALIGRISKGKSVLNCFSYTGAFSVYARAGGATDTTNIDISPGAVETARLNHKLNNFDDQQTTYISEDIFTWLEQLPVIPQRKIRNEKGRYDIIILDPPAFTHSKANIESGIEAYYKLNLLALERLGSGQYLATASCSSRITDSQFSETIARAANESGRRIRQLYNHGADEDHPVLVNSGIAPYLKFHLYEVC